MTQTCILPDDRSSSHSGRASNFALKHSPRFPSRILARCRYYYLWHDDHLIPHFLAEYYVRIIHLKRPLATFQSSPFLPPNFELSFPSITSLLTSLLHRTSLPLSTERSLVTRRISRLTFLWRHPLKISKKNSSRGE